MVPKVGKTTLYLLVALLSFITAQPVVPIYDRAEAYKLFTSPPPEKLETIKEMAARGATHYHELVCQTNGDAHAHSFNLVRDASYNPDLKLDPHFLNGTTYWINDYLHVGHVHYDIALIAAAQAIPLDRIVMQRAACHGTLCVGIGSIDSFYKGYFAALLSAAGNLDVPVYTRFEGKNRKVAPLKYSTDPKEDYYNATAMNGVWSRTMELQQKMYFERLIRRTDLHYGAVGAVSAESIQKFKKAAYALIPCDPPLTSYFDAKPPYRILFAYRGNKASRQIQNHDEFVNRLRSKFPAPDYELRTLNTSDSYLTFQVQLQAVAQSHVVIANHGAFEGNMIYMRNASLLVELFGNYGNNEIHTFQRLAIMFGLYYGRLHAESLVDHQAKYFNMTDVDINKVEGMLGEYFERKPFLLNLKTGV